jgi:hypothetical protein
MPYQKQKGILNSLLTIFITDIDLSYPEFVAQDYKDFWYKVPY